MVDRKHAINLLKKMSINYLKVKESRVRVSSEAQDGVDVLPEDYEQRPPIQNGPKIAKPFGKKLGTTNIDELLAGVNKLAAQKGIE